jgi:Zn-dependent peptidase ImmA (M78 family)
MHKTFGMLQLNVSNHIQTAACHKPENRTAGEIKIKKAQVLVNYLPQTKYKKSYNLFLYVNITVQIFIFKQYIPVLFINNHKYECVRGYIVQHNLLHFLNWCCILALLSLTLSLKCNKRHLRNCSKLC